MIQIYKFIISHMIYIRYTVRAIIAVNKEKKRANKNKKKKRFLL